MSKRKICLFGGTFNPIHNGHLIIAEQIKTLFYFDKIYFIPSYIPPHKTIIEYSYVHRLRMVNLAIKDNFGFYSSSMEISHECVSYTIDTIKEFKSLLGDVEIFFIIGSDAFLEIHTWKNAEDILNLCRFIVINRSSGDYFKMMNNSHKLFIDNYSHLRLQSIDMTNPYDVETNGDIIYINLEPIGISSTHIRRLVENEKSIRYMVNDKVIEYIYKNNLYKPLK